MIPVQTQKRIRKIPDPSNFINAANGKKIIEFTEPVVFNFDFFLPFFSK